MTPSLETEPGPHWWKASGLTTTPPLLSNDNITDNIFSIEVLHGSHIGWQDDENFLH